MYRMLIQSTEENLYVILIAGMNEDISRECELYCGHPGITIVKWQPLKKIENSEDAVVIDFFSRERVA